ncbi:MAG: class I SAM-dependent methyltransferase [Spirochaetaceae bacterium]
MKTFSMQPNSSERFEEVTCAVCGSADARERYALPEARFVRCRRCGHTYQSPRPVFDDLKERYQDAYFDYEIDNEQAFFRLMLQGLGDIDFRRIESSLNGTRRFLDVGCATGMLLEHMKDRGWTVHGVEICAPAAEYGTRQRGVPIDVATLEDSGLPTAAFDVVHLSHLIEHVPDPRTFLAEAARVTKIGGHLVMVTPDIGGFQSRLFGKRWRSAIADHLHLFSYRVLRRLVEESGFEVVRKRSWGGIAAGMASGRLKRLADTWAKRLNVGDVMILLARRLDRS